MKIYNKDIKILKSKENGRSSNFITPSFIFGCLYKCSYCTLKRHNFDTVQIANNWKDILRNIAKDLKKYPDKNPDQTDDKYYTYDIGCNTDINLMLKYLPWFEIFDFFKEHPKAKATFASKYVNKKLLKYNPEGKIRVRMSLQPQYLSTITEPNTSLIIDRIKFLKQLYLAGYDTQINFSPVIYTPTWKEDYIELFKLIRDNINFKTSCEVIFLTQNEGLHNKMVNINPIAENICWKPELIENKISSYGRNNMRYKWQFKAKLIEEFKTLLNQYLPEINIRYIF